MNYDETVRDSGQATADTLVVRLGDRSGASASAIRPLLGSHPSVLSVAEFADGGRNLFRGRGYKRIAVTGAPPEDELGWGIAALLAVLARPDEVACVDVARADVVTEPLARFALRSVPFALTQLAVSAGAIAAQRAAIAVARRAPLGADARLSRLVYLFPSVGTPAAVGGSVTHAHGVIRALQSEGVGIEAFTTNAALARTAKSELGTSSPWRLVRAPRIAKAIAASHAVGGDVALMRSALVAARNADAIYQRHVRFSLAGPLLSRVTGKPLILEYNGSEEFASRHWGSTVTPLMGRIAACEDAALTAASLIVVVSEVGRRLLVERGVDSGRILVNPNGVDAERFDRGGGRELRIRCGIDPDSAVIGFVGTFGPWHGAPTLGRAFVRLGSRVPKSHLLLVGGGKELEATTNIVRRAGLDRSLTVAGPVAPSEVPTHLDACDILVAPHVPLAAGVDFFGSPTKLFEYMAAGKAIVASRLGQIAEVLEHGVTGWLVEPGDVEDLYDGLAVVASNAALRQELGLNARQRAVVHHSWGSNARSLIDAYRVLATEAG